MLGLNSLHRRALPAGLGVTALLAALVSTGVAAADETDDVLGTAERVEVSTNPGDPVEIGPGLWSDVLEPAPAPGHQFAYERRVNQSSVHISVIGLLEVGDAVEIRTSAGRVDDCGNASFEAASSEGWEQVPVGTRLSVANTELSSECMLQSVPLRIEVVRDSGSTVHEDLPIRIKIVEEAPLSNPNEAGEGGSMPAPPDSEPPFVAPSSGDADAVEPGRGFDDATELTAGTVSATIKPGEAHFYRAPLDWGQTLAAQLEVEPLAWSGSEDPPYSGPDIALDVADPLRNTTPANLADTSSTATTQFEDPDGDSESATATTGLGPVVWRDRFENDNAYLPGDHWIVVSVQQGEDAPDEVSVPYTLSMEVQGEKDEAPAYAADSEGFLIGDDIWTTGASGTLATHSDDAWFTARRGAGLGLVGGGVVCVALGVWQVRRSRN